MSTMTAARIRWQWGLLALLALLLTITGGGEGAQHAGAQASQSQINISAADIDTFQPLGGVCFGVRDGLQNPLFEVCDNDFQSGFPQSSSVCVPDGDCHDEDPRIGFVQVTVESASYSVIQTKAPPGYDPDPFENSCDATSSKCAVVFFSVPVPSPQISISAFASYSLPRACFEVSDDAQNPLFQVCDNDSQDGFPQSSSVCVPDGVCEDENAGEGLIDVLIEPGLYSVTEIKLPPNHNLTFDLKRDCDASDVRCFTSFLHEPTASTLFPWDLNGDGAVSFPDFLQLLQHFGEIAP